MNGAGGADVEFRIRWTVRVANTRRGRLGDHQHSAKRSFEREEIALDSRRPVAATAGLDPVVFSRAQGRKAVSTSARPTHQATAIVALRPMHCGLDVNEPPNGARVAR